MENKIVTFKFVFEKHFSVWKNHRSYERHTLSCLIRSLIHFPGLCMSYNSLGAESFLVDFISIYLFSVHTHIY